MQARIAEDSARKTLQLAELAAKRLEGSIDDNEYMRSAYKAEIDSLNAQLDVLKKNREKARIVAPVAGPILEKYVSDRRVLPPGTPLLKLGDLTSMEIECDILSEDAGRVKAGQAVAIEGKAMGGKSVEGKVKRVYPSAFMKISSLGIEQQRVKVLIDFDNSQLSLRAGTRVDVRIITNAHDKVVAVPERATFRREGKWYIFTVQGGRAELTPISIGLKNESWAEVSEGLKDGDEIVLEPGNELTPGMRVAEKTI
jgi:HlyD family secretion protein